MHRLAVGRDDDIAELAGCRIHAVQSRPRGRRARNGAHHDHALDSEPRRQRLGAGNDADARRRDPATSRNADSGTTRLTTSTGMAKPMPALEPDGE